MSLSDIKVRRGEIWIADLSPTRGREQRGTRPILIISDNMFNKSAAELCIILPLTSTLRNIPSHIPVIPPEGGLKNKSAILCEMVRSISKDRLIEKWGNISEKTMVIVEDVLRMLMGLA